jgi:hypothetical protein
MQLIAPPIDRAIRHISGCEWLDDAATADSAYSGSMREMPDEREASCL